MNQKNYEPQDFSCESCNRNTFYDLGDHYSCATCGTDRPKENQNEE